MMDEQLLEDAFQYLHDLRKGGTYQVADMCFHLECVFLMEGDESITVLREWIKHVKETGDGGD